MEEKIKQIMSNVLGVSTSDITDETTMENIPIWDSLMHMSLVEALESNFSILFSIDEIIQMTSVARIKEILTSKGV